MILFAPAGDAFEVSDSQWSDLLACARRHGLDPNVDYPDAPWEVNGASWTGGYESPLGFDVTRTRATALAKALSRAMEAGDEFALSSELLVSSFRHFVNTDAFIVCPTMPAKPFQQSLHGLAQQVGVSVTATLTQAKEEEQRVSK